MDINLEKRIKRQILGKKQLFTVFVPLGFERTFTKELEEFQILEKEDTFILESGKVHIQTKLRNALKIIAYCRIPNKLLMEITKFRAENFRKLEREILKINWEIYLPKATNLKIYISTSHSRLYHSEAIKERFILFFKQKPNFFSEKEWEQRLYVDFNNDFCSIKIDLSGEELYKRGFHRFVNDAPLKENLAYAILYEGYHQFKFENLMDPMAGSGTFSLEWAYKCNHVFPINCRDFSIKHLPFFPAETWNYLAQNAKNFPKIKSKILTSDISKKSIEIISHNVATSPLTKNSVTLKQKDFFTYNASKIPNNTLIVLNPPYGKRLKINAPQLYLDIGKKLNDLQDIAIAILAPKGNCSKNLLKFQKGKNIAVKTTSHGGLSLKIYFIKK